jgi:hypothetical protein
VALEIHAGFACELRKGETAHLQVIVDSSNSNIALVQMAAMRDCFGHADGGCFAVPKVTGITKAWEQFIEWGSAT